MINSLEFIKFKAIKTYNVSYQYLMMRQLPKTSIEIGQVPYYETKYHSTLNCQIENFWKILKSSMCKFHNMKSGICEHVIDIC